MAATTATPPLVAGVQRTSPYHDTSSVLELPGAAMLGGLISRALGVDPIAAVAAVVGHVWAFHPALVSMRPRKFCDDRAAGVLHICLVNQGSGAQAGALETLLNLVDEAFGACVSQRHPPPVPVVGGACITPARPVYAVGSPIVSHQRILKPSPTRTVRALTNHQLLALRHSFPGPPWHDKIDGRSTGACGSEPLPVPLTLVPLEHFLVVLW